MDCKNWDECEQECLPVKQHGQEQRWRKESPERIYLPVSSQFSARKFSTDDDSLPLQNLAGFLELEFLFLRWKTRWRGLPLLDSSPSSRSAVSSPALPSSFAVTDPPFRGRRENGNSNVRVKERREERGERWEVRGERWEVATCLLRDIPSFSKLRYVPSFHLQ